jgi:hypothetical protein
MADPSKCRGCHNEAVRKWRAADRDTLNLARRVKHEPQPCVECGKLFVPGRSDALVCKDCVGGGERAGREAAP